MKKILVIRNDKIGDFMLIWPALSVLKNSYPGLSITALVPEYTKSLAELCPFIDDIIIDVGVNASKALKQQTLSEIRQRNFDFSISFISNYHNTWLTYWSKIPYRLAPATKIFQYFYTHRLKQRRSHSLKPEFVYNIDLVTYFLARQQLNVSKTAPPYLVIEENILNQQKNKLLTQLKLSDAQPWCFVHVGTGGSAKNLSLSQYAELIEGILANYDYQIVLTAGPEEADMVKELMAKLFASARSIALYDKNDGLKDFVYSLACADLFIAGSTGPLHISAALGKPTIGFFPSKRSASTLRWTPINQAEHHLAFSPTVSATKEESMQSIVIEEIMPKVNQFIQQHWKNE